MAFESDIVRDVCLSANWKKDWKHFFCGWSRCVCLYKASSLGMNRTCWQVSSGNENWFPSEKWWKVKEVFLQSRERRRAVRGQRYTESERFHARLAASAVLLICAASKPFRLSPPRAWTEMTMIFPSLRPLSSSSLSHCFFLFLNTWKSLPLFLFSIEWNNPVSCHLSLRLSVSTCLFHLISCRKEMKRTGSYALVHVGFFTQPLEVLVACLGCSHFYILLLLIIWSFGLHPINL